MKKRLGSVWLPAFAAGCIAGYAVCAFLENRPFRPEKVLRAVRKQAAESLPVEGAWITLSPDTLTRDALSVKVYRGGLTLAGDPPVRHYDFIADARTGALLELKMQK